MTEISGRTAVVTGGGSGIGQGLCAALANEGCAVVVADIVKAHAEAVAEEIRRTGGRAVAIACDVSDRASVRAMKSEANRLFGPVSLMFANAGVTLFKPFIEMTDDEIDWVIQVDMMGVFHCVQTFLPDMVAARDGHIFATSSFSGLLSPFMENHAPYVAAKAGVLALMLAMRHELRESGVGSTVLCPGAVSTNINASFRSRPARYGGPSDAKANLPIEESLQMHLTPDEVAKMILLAVRKNRPVLVTHGSAKNVYEMTANIVLSAFDDALEFDEM